MDGIAQQIWLPILTLVLGAVLAAVFDTMKDTRTLQREREARNDHRIDSLRARRVEFQHATLLELQNAQAQLVRMTGKSHLEDATNNLETGKWQKMPLSDEVDLGFLEAITEFGKLYVRVRNEEIRTISETLSESCTKIALSTSYDQAKVCMRSMLAETELLTEKIGVVLRNLDQDEEELSR